MSNPILPELKFDGFTYELKNAVYGIKNQSPELSYYTSFKGRGCCLINTFGHGIGAVGKPFVYLIYAIVCTIFAFTKLVNKDYNESKENAWKAISALGCVLISPLSQAILAVRAAFGAIFHPRIYFTKRPQSIDIAAMGEDNLKRHTLVVSYKCNKTETTQLEIKVTERTKISDFRLSILSALKLQTTDVLLITGKTETEDSEELDDDAFVMQYLPGTINISLIER